MAVSDRLLGVGNDKEITLADPQSGKGQENPAVERVKWWVFALAGVLSLFILYIGFVEAVIFEKLYVGMRYTFFVSVPSYIAVIPAIGVTSLLKKTSLVK